MDIGGQIRRVRNDKEYTQAEMAEQLGISENHYSKLERGTATPTLKLLQTFVTAFETSIVIEPEIE